MDMTWLTDRIAVGGGIWTADNMAAVARAGVTHIIDMQIEFDDRVAGRQHLGRNLLQRVNGLTGGTSRRRVAARLSRKDSRC